MEVTFYVTDTVENHLTIANGYDLTLALCSPVRSKC